MCRRAAGTGDQGAGLPCAGPAVTASSASPPRWASAAIANHAAAGLSDLRERYARSGTWVPFRVLTKPGAATPPHRRCFAAATLLRTASAPLPCMHSAAMDCDCLVTCMQHMQYKAGVQGAPLAAGAVPQAEAPSNASARPARTSCCFFYMGPGLWTEIGSLEAPYTQLNELCSTARLLPHGSGPRIRMRQAPDGYGPPTRRPQTAYISTRRALCNTPTLATGATHAPWRHQKAGTAPPPNPKRSAHRCFHRGLCAHLDA